MSVTIADMPLTKHCFPASFRIWVMASIVLSAEVPSSKKIAIIVPVSELNTSYTLSGSMLWGTDMSMIESYHKTFSTWSTSSIFAFSSATSLSSMPSTINIEKAPVPKSSIIISWPFIVSISSGR